jgi:hypothetical protein
MFARRLARNSAMSLAASTLSVFDGRVVPRTAWTSR